MTERTSPRSGLHGRRAASRGFTLIADLNAARVSWSGAPTGAGGSAYLTPVPGVTLAFDRADGWLSGLTVQLGPAGSPVTDEAVAWIAGMFGNGTAAAVRDAHRAPARQLLLRTRAHALRAAARLARLEAARVTSPVPAAPLWDAEAVALARLANARLPRRVRGGAGSPAAQLDESSACLPAAVQLRAPCHPMAGIGTPSSTVPWSGPRVHAFLDPGLVPPRVFRFGLWPETDLILRPDPSGAPLFTAEASLLSGATGADLADCRVRMVRAAGRQVLATAPLHVCRPARTADGGEGRTARAHAILPVTAEAQALIRCGEVWAEIVADGRRPADGTRLRHIRRALRWADAALRAESRPHGLADETADYQWLDLAALAWERCQADWEAAGRLARAALAATRSAAGGSHPFLAEAVPATQPGQRPRAQAHRPRGR